MVTPQPWTPSPTAPSREAGGVGESFYSLDWFHVVRASRFSLAAVHRRCRRCTGGARKSCAAIHRGRAHRWRPLVALASRALYLSLAAVRARAACARGGERILIFKSNALSRPWFQRYPGPEGPPTGRHGILLLELRPRLAKKVSFLAPAFPRVRRRLCVGSHPPMRVPACSSRRRWSSP